ncbi:hypothetical protein GGI05_000764, partial [Coemansia sp. RSA 2603]
AADGGLANQAPRLTFDPDPDGRVGLRMGNRFRAVDDAQLLDDDREGDLDQHVQAVDDRVCGSSASAEVP